MQIIPFLLVKKNNFLIIVMIYIYNLTAKNAKGF